MTPPILDAYLQQLENELRRRGLEWSRIVDESREHLLDAVESGRARGLSIDDAEREALDRFGSPETIAAHVSERHFMMGKLANVVDTLWQRKWWILAPTLVTAVVTIVLSYYLLPPRYRSEAIVRIISPRVATELRSKDTERSRLRFQQTTQMILSRPRLERIISDFGLYRVNEDRAALADAVHQMRKDVSLNFLASEDAHDNEVGGFSVSFVSSDPQMAKQITERFLSLVIEHNLFEKERQVLAVSQFIGSQTDDMRGRLVAYEKRLEDLRAVKGGRSLSRADLLPYEVLQEKYKALLVSAEELRIATSLERGQLGEQFRVIEEARVPERPLGPSRWGVTATSTFAGFAVGLALAAVRGRPKSFS